MPKTLVLYAEKPAKNTSDGVLEEDYFVYTQADDLTIGKTSRT